MIDNIKKSFSTFKPSINKCDSPSFYSVLIPLLQINNSINILFQVRSNSLKSQPGEISFPGGKFEKHDVLFEKTAIRETCEELGIDEKNIDIICPLNTFVAPFNMVIYPFLGEIKNFDCININKDEVDHIFLAPLNFFIDNEPSIYKTDVHIIPHKNFPYHLISYGQNYKFKTGTYDVLFYEYKDYVIWGITAKILKDFIDSYKKRK
ncbi:8-oxo-dGTP pyrophosphatase MutT, NUDIX family [Alkalithermobacter thermoalcaliphilus JW-YL-7 = DSM 7308]|uniref:8-oxo-dGTP pyrophosphatase MutT, NUDIX family n=1 Tax=Alkalithermobacter thermoalcaliphilus JW-YL-7 = DSM 7308 TaxID=1121328 RepID=A0A150FR49_CLOPD|nr:NUDIX hydrolase [[Clostridium] paradoxum JW-YL-7 = DSM 7308]SHL25765.1 8-oxo-dGTP pyrophosphatase MutT, NUDIX family [[Clostridium] paradoxum JW-YL-7 = DSM 7308]